MEARLPSGAKKSVYRTKPSLYSEAYGLNSFWSFQTPCLCLPLALVSSVPASSPRIARFADEVKHDESCLHSRLSKQSEVGVIHWSRGESAEFRGESADFSGDPLDSGNSAVIFMYLMAVAAFIFILRLFFQSSTRPLLEPD